MNTNELNKKLVELTTTAIEARTLARSALQRAADADAEFDKLKRTTDFSFLAKVRNCTQREIAEIVGVPVQYISNIENNRLYGINSAVLLNVLAVYARLELKNGTS